MGFFEAVGSVFAGYFKFSGRASRSEYWWFFLFEILVGGAAMGFDIWTIMSAVNAAGGDPDAMLSIGIFDYMTFYYFLITFFPRMCVTVRRLHDVGLSGFFYLFYFVPVVGGLVVFVLTLLPSEASDNNHGSPHRPMGGRPRAPSDGTRKRDPMQGYAVLYNLDKKPTPEMQAARKAEVRALYEQRVLGKGPIVAE